MGRSADTPTLLVFTLGPGCERSRRRLLPAPLRQAEVMLHQQGLESALAAGRRAGFRIVVSSPESLGLPLDVEFLPQRGQTFSERLRDAIHDLQVGLDGASLLVVGTDTPDLDVHHLRTAVDLLAQTPDGVVLGPSLDGGFYLLATRAILDEELAKARWCRSDTLQTLETELRSSGRRVRHLTPLRDLDRYADVELWLSRRGPLPANSWLHRFLSSLLARWRRPHTPTVVGRPRIALVSTAFGRAPPR